MDLPRDSLLLCVIVFIVFYYRASFGLLPQVHYFSCSTLHEIMVAQGLCVT